MSRLFGRDRPFTDLAEQERERSLYKENDQLAKRVYFSIKDKAPGWEFNGRVFRNDDLGIVVRPYGDRWQINSLRISRDRSNCFDSLKKRMIEQVESEKRAELMRKLSPKDTIG